MASLSDDFVYRRLRQIMINSRGLYPLRTRELIISFLQVGNVRERFLYLERCSKGLSKLELRHIICMSDQFTDDYKKWVSDHIESKVTKTN